MTKEEFYWSKHIVAIEWWLHECDLPNKLTWARLRVFDDATADSCFEEGGKLYGFENRDFAAYILSEDEYISSQGMDAEDEQEYGIKLAEIYTPAWLDNPVQLFEYFGSY